MKITKLYAFHLTSGPVDSGRWTGSLALRPTPNLEDQGILCLVSTLWPVRHGWPYQEYKTSADIALGVIETHKLPTTIRWWSYAPTGAKRNDDDDDDHTPGNHKIKFQSAVGFKKHFLCSKESSRKLWARWEDEEIPLLLSKSDTRNSRVSVVFQLRESSSKLDSNSPKCIDM